MSNEPNTDKRQLSLRIDLDVCKRVERKYTLPGDTGRVTAYLRALEDATREVVLTPEDYEAMREESRQNMIKRMQKRRGR